VDSDRRGEGGVFTSQVSDFQFVANHVVFVFVIENEVNLLRAASSPGSRAKDIHQVAQQLVVG
jgi:hypothetical protein